MRVILLSLSLAIIFGSSCNGLSLANLQNLSKGLSNAQTLGQATMAALGFLRDNFDPSLDVNGIYKILQQQYGSKLDASYTYNLSPASVINFITSLVSIYQNRSNNSNYLGSIIDLIMQTGIVNMPTGSPTGSPTGPTPTMNPNPYGFLSNAFGSFAKNFFMNLLSSLQPGQLDSIIGNTTIQLLTPEVINALKAVIQVANPGLYDAIKDVNDPQSFYFLGQAFVKPYANAFLNQIGSYFGVDFNSILNPNGTQTPPAVTTVAPTDPYLDSLYKLLTELDAGKANFQMGTQLTKAIFLGSVLMKYPNVTAVWIDRLRINNPNIYQQIASINDTLTALIQLVPYLPVLLSIDLQRIKSVYGVDYSYLLTNTYILSINPTNPPSTSAGSTQPTATQTTTRPASTLPPSSPPPSTPSPTVTQTTTRPASTLPPSSPPPSTQAPSTPPPTTAQTTTRPPSTLPPSTQPPTTPPPSTTRATSTTPATTTPATTTPATTTPTTTFNWLNAFTTTASTTKVTASTSARTKPAFG